MLGRRAAQGAAAAARITALAAIAAGAAISGSFATATPVAASGPKVVIVVGPTNGATSTYITRAKGIADTARSIGASVTEIYTPHATWARVSAAAQGAKLFVYLGHGSGYPSPYGFHPTSTDGMGLNPYDGSGTTSPVKYYGESLIASTINLAPGGVVFLNHLCYASGSGEPGMAEPSWDVARQRVDNYAAGFLGTGAGAVVADAYTNVTYEIKAAIRSGSGGMLAAWRSDPNYNGHERSFASTRTSGFRNYLDPSYANSVFYRAITVRPPTVNTQAVAPLAARTLVSAMLRTKPSETASAVMTLAQGVNLQVTGRLVVDAKFRTWAPVKTSSGKTGYVAAWLLNLTGTAVPVTSVNVRTSPSETAGIVTTVPSGQRVSVLRSTKDSKLRVWLNVRTASGKTGWMAGWLMRP
ncbi:MAG TPA: SH3 domain-containing protein [Candidatus Limnocylindrales bacterium]|nr:SH3 domain-containing protein [Candidatus Limnocylindrales bacterium]